jgi:glycosyltransferase involved in cell wall biosynthesis
MTKGRRLLLPWYRYPPFRKEGIGGLSVAVWELTKELAGRGVHVDVLTAPPRGREENKDYPPGLSVSNSSLGEKFFKNELLKEGESRFLDRYDAILSVANYGARTLRSSDRAFDRVTRQIHTIGHDRNLDSYVSLRPSILEYFRMLVAKRKEEKNEKFLFGSKCICISCYLLRKMSDNNLEASDSLFWIPNGIQTRLFRPMENERIYDLLFVGRFQKAKGLDLLLSALRLIQITKGDVYKFAVAGEFTEEQRSFLRKTVPAAVAERIVFLGTVQRGDMPKVINSTKLVVVPSRYESFGLPALEAIACGVPVLATKVGGLPEIIDETVGLLVDPDNQALAKGIYTSINNTSLAERAAVNGPARAERYDWRIVAPRIIRTLFLKNQDTK